MGYGTTRARRSVRLTTALTLGTLALGSLAASDDGGTLEPAGDTPREEMTLQATAATAGTTFRIERSGTGVLKVDEGPDLDSYVFRSGSPLSISIDTAPYGEDQDRDVPTWGPVDSQGHPAAGHAFHGKVGRLTLRVFDVDDDYAGGQFAPEVDEVSVNGTTLPGALSGADNQWSINTFEVPLELVRFPTADDPAGTNTVEIAIDTANTGGDVWAVEADWLELRLDVDAVPLGVAHGLGDTAEDMTFMAEWFRDNVDGLGDNDVKAHTHASAGLIEDNAATIGQELAELRAATGATTANVIAHSKGGLDSRRYAFDNPSRVESLVMLGTPNGGSELAQDYCDSAMGGGLGIRGVLGRRYFAPSDCRTEDDPTYQTTQTYVRDVFNAMVRDSPRVDYFTIAGQNSFVWAAGWLNGEDDGLVEVESVRWLRFDRPTDPGRHDYWRDALPENHAELAGRTAYRGRDHTSAAWPIAACHMYGLRTDTSCERNRVTASTMSSATATMVEPSSEVSIATDLRVPAGSTVSLPIDLESSAGAHVAVLGAGVDQALVELPGAEFTATQLLGRTAVGGSTAGLGATELTVTNTSGNDLDLGVLVWVETTRTVVLDAPALTQPGEPATLVATVSEPDPSDALTVTVEGQQVPMTSEGEGRWTARVTPSGAGHWHAVVLTGGDRARVGSATVSVATGQASLEGTFVESVERSSSGRITELTVAPRIASDVAGRWRVTLTLRGTDGSDVTSATGVAELPAGGGTVPVTVTGDELHAGGLDGPWTITDVLLVEEATDHFVDHVAELGRTGAYRLGELDRATVLIDDRFTDRGVDTDGDGDFDRLQIAGQVSVERATTYAVNGRLVAADGTELGEAAAFTSLAAGANDITFTFDGAAIGASGYDGPYRLVDVSVYAPSDGDAFDYLIEAHETAAYRSYEFEGGAVTLERIRTQLETERAAGRVSDGVARSLDAKLISAAAAFERDNDGAACNKLEAFVNELEAQRDQHLDAAAYDRLRPLIGRLRAQRCSTA